MSLGEKIKFLRTKNGLTQENFAEELNVSRSAIAKWETNSGVPEVNNLKRISEIFDVSLDELLNDKKKNDKVDSKSDKVNGCPEYKGYFYDIELSGWNDGVYDVLIVGEDKDFIFYQKSKKEDNLYGAIGKKYITSIGKRKKSLMSLKDTEFNGRKYFCAKHVLIELAAKDGLIKGFLDFRNDDYMDVSIDSFTDIKILLKFGREINIDAISKIEELENRKTNYNL